MRRRLDVDCVLRVTRRSRVSSRHPRAGQARQIVATLSVERFIKEMPTLQLEAITCCAKVCEVSMNFENDELLVPTAS